MRICIIASYGPSLLNFRGPLLKALVDQGQQVWAISSRSSETVELEKRLAELGVIFCPIPLARGGLNPISDIRTFLCLLRLLWQINPDRILAYTVKPVIYTGLAVHYYRCSRPHSCLRYVAMITGLGYAFTAGGDIKIRSLLRYLLQRLYRVSLRSAQAVVFQNPDDRLEFQAMNLIPPTAQVVRVWGSGVDLQAFSPQPLPQEPVFLMLARLLTDKGICEYVEAACQVKKKYPAAVFRLAGPLDCNPTAIRPAELQTWIAERVIDYLGDLPSVQSSLAECRFYVLPSYREGTPRSVLEAMATGRPIITTDVPGCRETVIHGHNGFLVPPGNASALAQAMLKLIEQSPLQTQLMAYASVKLAQERFDVNKVNLQLLKVIDV